MFKFKTLLASLTLFVSLSTSAAPLDIDTMYIDNASASFTVGGFGPFTASSGIAPAAEITMGNYQSSILNISSNDFSLNIYSTDLYGAAAPSGYVDGTMIDVDFSSLRGLLSYSGNDYDFELWPLTTVLDSGTYNSGNGEFDISWTENLLIDLNPFLSSNATLEVNLQGYLTAVPLPAAIWLFASGMLALFGFTHSKRRKH